jgi:hypothetical protein
MKENKPKPKKKVYKSPEARARQLAGLANVRIEDYVMGTDVQKVNGLGRMASVSEDMRKQVIDLYCQGLSVRAIEERTGISKSVVHEIKTACDGKQAMLRIPNGSPACRGVASCVGPRARAAFRGPCAGWWPCSMGP